MIKNKKVIWIVVILIGIYFWMNHKSQNKTAKETIREITATVGTIETIISSTGTVQPQNRLEIKPPIDGRIEKILVKEGEVVKAGQILALMSSTDRAALLDAAHAQGEESLKYWQDVYKSTPLIAPIDGNVIVSTNQPGQTVGSSDVVIVLSDQLIVQAQVDETDVGKVSIGQTARISLDAYPDISVKGKVDHVYYESKVVNNVSIYQVDILLDTIPTVFRSGMSTNVDIVTEHKDHIVLLPQEAVKQDGSQSYVLVKAKKNKKPVKQDIEIGISDDKNVEVVSGVKENDTVLIVSKEFVSPKSKIGSNPFMPNMRRPSR